MDGETNKVELPERPDHTPTEALIRLHYKRMGCLDWDRNKFLRLARALNETPEELAARVGLVPAELRARLAANKFKLSEGILLTLHWRFIEAVTTGQNPKDELFSPLNAGRLRDSQEQGAD